MPVYKVLLSRYRYARMLATCYYTRSPYCCCVATIVHTGDQLPDPRLVSRALISREARVSHFAPRETTNSLYRTQHYQLAVRDLSVASLFLLLLACSSSCFSLPRPRPRLASPSCEGAPCPIEKRS